MINNISVVVTIFNDSNILSRFISDIENQSVKPKEVVIADGGSKDNSFDILEKWKNESEIQIRLFFGERLNISEGFNKAIKEATEDRIVIMAVGNQYPANFIEELNREMDNGYDAVYTPIRGNDVNDFSKLYNKAILHTESVMNMPSNHGVMIKKQVIEELGFFYEKFSYAGEDLEMFARFNKFGKKGKCTDKTHLYWDTPISYKEFKKQVYVYLVGMLQASTNWYVLRHKKKELLYLITIILAIILSIFGITRIVGIALFAALLIFNIILIIKYSFRGCLLNNAQIFLNYIYLFKAGKFLLNKNKIDINRRLK
ncbi:MAG: glycosyltransferase [Lachnospiraceae bacterium]|nr:glycosyltransferase [Lachnospiraceae bacterium]